MRAFLKNDLICIGDEKNYIPLLPDDAAELADSILSVIEADMAETIAFRVFVDAFERNGGPNVY